MNLRIELELMVTRVSIPFGQLVCLVFELLTIRWPSVLPPSSFKYFIFSGNVEDCCFFNFF